MILIIQNSKVLATHTDAQQGEITFALYPFADAIIQILPGLTVTPGDDDPRLTHPEYVIGATVKLTPLYATLALSGGDGRTPIGLKLGHPTKGIMDISGDIRLTPDTPGLPVNISYAWRITIRQVISEYVTQAISSIPVDGCEVINNTITWTGFNPETYGLSAGIYMISDEDFATISGAAFGLPQDYQVKLVGGNKFFKVLK